MRDHIVQWSYKHKPMTGWRAPASWLPIVLGFSIATYLLLL